MFFSSVLIVWFARASSLHIYIHLCHAFHSYLALACLCNFSWLFLDFLFHPQINCITFQMFAQDNVLSFSLSLCLFLCLFFVHLLFFFLICFRNGASFKVCARSGVVFAHFGAFVLLNNCLVRFVHSPSPSHRFAADFGKFEISVVVRTIFSSLRQFRKAQSINRRTIFHCVCARHR